MASSSFLRLQFPTLPITRHGQSSFPASSPSSLLSSSRKVSIFGVSGPAPIEPIKVAYSTGYNVQVVVGEDEPDEVLLRRFRREVTKAGVIQECKRRRFFENKQEEKKRKAREAGKRNRRRRSGPRTNFTAASKPEGSKPASEDAEDNWEMPVEDIPI
ncbi:small ribosomal subunit protein bS21c-like [Wolffia australiana]